MSAVSVAIDRAAANLNDPSKTLWTDAILLPFAKQAQEQLSAELFLNGIPVVKEETSSPIAVASGATSLGGSQPADLVEPISIGEREGGSSNNFTPVGERDFIPQVDSGPSLLYWAWRDEKILFLAPNTNREILLRYVKKLVAITAVGDPIGFIYGENYLAPKIAALAAASLGNTSTAKIQDAISEVQLDKVIRANIKGNQSLPARRIPYRRGTGRRYFYRRYI